MTLNEKSLQAVEENVVLIESVLVEIKMMLAQMRKDESILPAPETKLTGYVISHYSKTNIRQRPSTRGIVSGTLYAGSYEETEGSVPDEDGSNYLWHKLKNGGYVRADVVTWVNTL